MRQDLIDHTTRAETNHDRQPPRHLSPDGTLIATVSTDRAVRIWHTATGQCLCAIRVAGTLIGLAWQPTVRRRRRGPLLPLVPQRPLLHVDPMQYWAALWMVFAVAQTVLMLLGRAGWQQQ